MKNFLTKYQYFIYLISLFTIIIFKNLRKNEEDFLNLFILFLSSIILTFTLFIGNWRINIIMNMDASALIGTTFASLDLFYDFKKNEIDLDTVLPILIQELPPIAILLSNLNLYTIFGIEILITLILFFIYDLSIIIIVILSGITLLLLLFILFKIKTDSLKNELLLKCRTKNNKEKNKNAKRK